jgi:KipI family sensor histidine kinase inhibitor
VDVAPEKTAPAWHIHAQGDRCLIIAFGDTIDAATGRTCLAVARQLREAGLPGVTDVVPSFVAVAVHYAPGTHGDGPTFAQLSARITALLERRMAVGDAAFRNVDIPVCYGGEHGPDLEDVARAAALAPAEIVALHTQPGSMVFMLGFAPGHPYIGVHDTRMNLPRRNSPRTAVPAGSVAIANRQTVIYPSRLPGGWNIIGATPLRLFDPERDPASLLQPGDRVRFVPIDTATFDRMRAEQA